MAIPAAIRVDAAFSKFVDIAEEEMAVAEEACKFGRFDAAAESLNRVETALDELRKARFAREEADVATASSPSRLCVRHVQDAHTEARRSTLRLVLLTSYFSGGWREWPGR